MSITSNFQPIVKTATNWSLKRRLIAHIVETFKKDALDQQSKEVVSEDDQYTMQALIDTGYMLRFVDYYRFFLVQLDENAFQTIEEGEPVTAHRRYSEFDTLVSLLTSQHLFDDKQLQAVFNGSFDKDAEKIRNEHPLLLVCRLEDETNRTRLVNGVTSTHPVLRNEVKEAYQINPPNLLYFIIKRKGEPSSLSTLCEKIGIDVMAGVIWTSNTMAVEPNEENLLDVKSYFDKSGVPYILEPIEDYTDGEKYPSSVNTYGSEYGYIMHVVAPPMNSIVEVFDVTPTLKDKPLNACDLLLLPPVDDLNRKQFYDYAAVNFKKGENPLPDLFKSSTEELLTKYVDNVNQYISPFNTLDASVEKTYRNGDIPSTYASLAVQGSSSGTTLTWPTFDYDYGEGSDNFAGMIEGTDLLVANKVFGGSILDDYLE